MGWMVQDSQRSVLAVVGVRRDWEDGEEKGVQLLLLSLGWKWRLWRSAVGACVWMWLVASVGRGWGSEMSGPI